MDDLVFVEPEDVKPLQTRHGKLSVNKPKHERTSTRLVQYNMPVFANFDKVIQGRPTHTSLTKSETEKAGLIDAMYEDRAGRKPIVDYLQDTNSPYSLVERTSEDVMVVRNRDTGQHKVVVKGIDPFSLDDHADLQTKLWLGEPTESFADALRVAREYDVNEIIGHSRGGSTSLAVAEELGIRSTGFNSVITHENVTKAHRASSAFKHTEYSNAEDFIVNGINDITNPHPHGKYPANIEFKTFAGVKGKGLLGQHDVSQWTQQNLNRHENFNLPMEELAFKHRHAGDLITAEMFSQGVREGKTYRQILHENENGFGIVDSNGRFTSRNFKGNNMSEIFQAVGGEHTPSEIDEMTLQGVQEPSGHTLTDNELAGMRSGAGADMIDHALDSVADTYTRLPELPTTTARTIGKGIYKSAADSMKASSLAEGLFYGYLGEKAASGLDRTIGKLPGELGKVEHAGVASGVAGALMGGIETGGYGLAAGVVGEGVRYGTDELLKKMGAGEGVRGNVDALMGGAAAGAVMGSALGPVGAAVGAGAGAVIGEGAHLVEEYGDDIRDAAKPIVNFFRNLF